MSVPEKGCILKEYYNNIIENDIKIFNSFVEWTIEEKKEFKKLLDELKSSHHEETTKEKGDRLEKLVSFIIEKSYFFELFRNVHTETNEIDEVIVFSNKGKQAIEKFQLSRKLIPIDSELFLGECKNYKGSLGVTYVGKFYSLLTATDNSFGIIFTQNGLTGESSGYKDAYGLVKILRMIEQSKNKKDFYILTFTIADYEELLNGKSFFELVEAKKKELQLGADYHTFLTSNKHENEERIKEIISNATG